MSSIVIFILLRKIILFTGAFTKHYVNIFYKTLFSNVSKMYPKNVSSAYGCFFFKGQQAQSADSRNSYSV